MARLRDSYTRYPRPILWLVRGGTLGDRTIAPFYLSKRPVTNVQFEAHAAHFERSPAAPGDDDPATGLSFDDARGYCAWYAEVSRKPMRLPTELEWTYACGPRPGSGEPYVNPFGLLDMPGDLEEFAVRPDGTGVLCGGSGGSPGSRLAAVGFRVARSLQ